MTMATSTSMATSNSSYSRRMMVGIQVAVISGLLSLLVLPLEEGVLFVDGFQPSCLQRWQVADNIYRLYSSVGDGGPPGKPPNDGSNNDELGDFLTPREESENLRQAREYMSENRLPLSFDTGVDEVVADEDESDKNEIESIQEDGEEEGGEEDDNEKDVETIEDLAVDDEENEDDEESSSIVARFDNTKQASIFSEEGKITEEKLVKNPYMQVVSKLSPSELIARFTETADPRVQEAVRTTILGLIGSLPKMAFDTKTITTGQRLASLMFQLQMTGYMFKNAEYRLSMSQSLGMNSESSSKLRLTGDVASDYHVDDEDDDPLLTGKVKGKLKIRYGQSSVATAEEEINNLDDDDAISADGEDGSPPSGIEVEVDAAAYMSELRSEVSKLKKELTQTREKKEEALRKDLLTYIRTLPAQELKDLTGTMSEDVLVCMKGLVQAVLSGISDDEIGPDTVTEQSGEAMAQLCMWQLAVGYNLRELEVREEMKRQLQTLSNDDDGNDDGPSSTGGVDFSQPGVME